MADGNHSLNSTGIKSKTHINFNRFSTHGGNNICNGKHYANLRKNTA